ncbi:hypothetical protein, partial [Anaerotignum faecicola]
HPYPLSTFLYELAAPDSHESRAAGGRAAHSYFPSAERAKHTAKRIPGVSLRPDARIDKSPYMLT